MIKLQTNSGTYYSLVMENDYIYYSYIMLSDKLKRLLLISGLEYEESFYEKDTSGDYFFYNLYMVKMYNMKEIKRFIEIMRIFHDDWLYIFAR